MSNEQKEEKAAPDFNNDGYLDPEPNPEFEKIMAAIGDVSISFGGYIAPESNPAYDEDKARKKIGAIIGTGDLNEFEPNLLSSAMCCFITYYMPHSNLKEELWKVRNQLKLQDKAELFALIEPLFENFHFDLHYNKPLEEWEHDSFELLELGIKVINLLNDLEKYNEVDLKSLTLELAKIDRYLLTPLSIDLTLLQANLHNLTIEEYGELRHENALTNNAYISLKDDSVMKLVAAANAGDTQQAEWLLENGADVNQKAVYGATALYIAAQKGDLAMVELLIKHGADVNAVLYNDATPLLVAIEKDHTEVVKFLIANGADVNQAGVCNQSPLPRALKMKMDCFVHYTDLSIVLMVLKIVHESPFKINTEMVQYLLKNGAEVTYDRGDSIISMVAARNDSSIIELFIKNCDERDSKIVGKENCLDVLAEFEQFASVMGASGLTME